jgi:hypothetical protein
MGWTHSFLDGVYLHSILGMFESQLQKKFWQIGMPLSIIINHKIFNTSSYLYIIKLQEKKLYKGKERKYTQMLTYKWHSWWLHGNKKLCLTAANCSDLVLTFFINKTKTCWASSIVVVCLLIRRLKIHFCSDDIWIRYHFWMEKRCQDKNVCEALSLV